MVGQVEQTVWTTVPAGGPLHQRTVQPFPAVLENGGMVLVSEAERWMVGLWKRLCR